MPIKSTLSEMLSMYGKSVKEFATVTAATSKRPYGRIKETWCATPTMAVDKLLQKVKILYSLMLQKEILEDKIA